MSLAEFRPIPLPKLGGLFTFLKPVDVPSGYSPNLQSVRFLPRAVLTRAGLTSRMGKNAQTFNGLMQLISNSGQKTLITEDTAGSVDFQNPLSPGNPASLQANAFTAGSFLFGKNAFGRTFLSAYNNDLSPAGPIRQWNGVRNFGPSAFNAVITVGDSVNADANWAAGALAYSVAVLFETTDGCMVYASQTAIWNTAGGVQPTITGIPLGPANLSVVARWIVFSLPGGSASFYRFPQFRIADNVTTSITLAGVSATGAGMEAAGSIIDQLSALLINPPCLYHLAPDGPAAAPTAADSGNAGSVAVGVHTVWVSFETIFGFITAPSPSTTWNAAGGKKALITNIPIGPWYVTARRVFFSSSGLVDLFYLSTFRIPNNSSTSIEVDFTDTNLLQGTNVDYLLKNHSIPSAAGMTSYGGRLCVWGQKNVITNSATSPSANMGFDGGWNLSTGAPLGWSLDGSFGTFGDKEQFNTFAGDAWRVTMHGAANTKTGMINNGSLVALQSIGAIATQTAYSISVRLRADAGIVAPGSANIELYSPSLGSLGLFQVPGNTIPTTWTEFSGLLTPGLASIPADMVIRVYVIGDGSTKRIWFDHLQPYPTLNPTETSVLRFSNPFDTETFDGVNGYQYIAKDNGEQITSVIQLRSFLYVFKERSMHVTYDDTINPPSLWVNRQIDSTIGCGSPRGLVSSDTFIAFSSRGGGYMFTGARPQKVSQEIQTTWNKINWSASASTHTLLDPQAKLVLFFVPMNGASLPQNSLVMDYSEGVGQEDDPGPRKWGLDLWSNPITGSLKFENSTVTQSLFGSAPNTQAIYLCGNKVYENTGTDDDGTPIDWFYETAFLKAGEIGQDMFGGAVFYAEGAGQLLVSLIGLDDVIVESLQNQIMSSTPGKQFEVYAQLESERARLRFEGLVDNSFATIKGVTLLAIPWATQRIH